MLLGALIPQSAVNGWGLPAGQALQFFAVLHQGLAEAVAERFHRRGELLAAIGDLGQRQSEMPEQMTGECSGQLPQKPPAECACGGSFAITGCVGFPRACSR